MKHILVLLLIAVGACVPSITFAAYPTYPNIIEFTTMPAPNDPSKFLFLWDTKNSDGCQLRETYTRGDMHGSKLIASVETEGIFSMTKPASTVTYELYCTKMHEGGSIAFTNDLVTVSPDESLKLPTCTLTAKPYRLLPGERTKLTWKTANATDVRWVQDLSGDILDLSTKKLRKRGSESGIFGGSRDLIVTMNLKGKKGTTGSCKTTLFYDI